MEPLIGKTLGQYQIVSEIGRGGMAAVYRGEQTSLGRPVAIKVLHHEFSSDPSLRSRFQREAYAIAQLAHPNILPMYDFGQDPATGTVYFVTQYVDGGTLAARMGSPLPPEQAARIAAQIARARLRPLARRRTSRCQTGERAVDLRPRTRSRLARTVAKLQVGQKAKGFGRWLLRTALGALVVLIIVAIVLLIASAFLIGSMAEQALASQRWVLNVEPGTHETVACTDIQKGVSQALQPYLLDALTDVATVCSPPDSIQLSGQFRGKPVSLQVRVFALNHAPAI